MIKKTIKEYIKRNFIIPISINNQLSMEAAIVNRQAFGDVKNICKGKQDIVICGAGPSLKDYKRIPGAIHIALNRAFMNSEIDFDYLVAVDYMGIKAYEKELIEYKPDKCIKFISSQRVVDEKTIPKSLVIKSAAREFCTDIYMRRGYSADFVSDIENQAVGAIPNVALVALQIALFMHPKTIYLAGCDISGGHFSNANLTSEEIAKLDSRYNDRLKSDLFKKWLEAKRFAEVMYPDVEMVSINPVGLKGVFKDIYQ